MLILWAPLPVQSQSEARKSLQKETCGDLWPVEQHKKWGYIDKTGRLIIPFTFDLATDFSEGLAAVEIKGKCGYIDRTGNFVIQCASTNSFARSQSLRKIILKIHGFQLLLGCLKS